MTSESYKKRIIITVFIIVFGFAIFAVTSSCNKAEKSADKTSKKASVPGPILDLNTGKIGVLEQLEENSENPELLARLGDQYFESGRFKEAIEIYEKVLKLNPNDVDTYNDLGLALHYIERSDTAIETFRKGTEVNPSYQRIWLSLGFVLTSTGKNKEAKVALKKALALDPNSEPGREAKQMLGLLK